MADTKTSALSTITGANTATGDKFPVLDTSDTTQGAGGTLKTITRAEMAAALAAEGVGGYGVIHVRDVKATTVAGGDSAATTWNVRDLNTTVENSISGASLASNQVTLPAGTYRVVARAPGYYTFRQQLRLYDTTGTATLVVGQSGYAYNGTQDMCHLRGNFTLATSSVLELQHYTTRAQVTLGLGADTSSGEDEIYSDVFIERIA